MTFIHYIENNPVYYNVNSIDEIKSIVAKHYNIQEFQVQISKDNSVSITNKLGETFAYIGGILMENTKEYSIEEQEVFNEIKTKIAEIVSHLDKVTKETLVEFEDPIDKAIRMTIGYFLKYNLIKLDKLINEN